MVMEFHSLELYDMSQVSNYSFSWHISYKFRNMVSHTFIYLFIYLLLQPYNLHGFAVAIMIHVEKELLAQ